MLVSVRKLSVGAVLSCLLPAACDTAAPPPTAPTDPGTRSLGPDDQTPHIATDLPFELRFDRDGTFVTNPNVPPAFRPSPTYAALKGDQYDDERAANPQFYAITEPPTRHVRPMVEWEPMKALAMAFPGYMLSSTNATSTVVQIAKVGSDYGEIWIAVDGTQAESGLKSRLTAAGMTATDIDHKIKFFRTDLDSIWFIDAGPLPIVDTSDDSYAFSDFRYYRERPLDDALPTQFARHLPDAFDMPSPVTIYRMPLTVEGGTFQATTDGVCITGSRQIWNLSCYSGSCDDSILSTPLDELQDNSYAQDMLATLETYTGCKALVVTNSITDDGTGHIDMYLKILDDDRVLVGEYAHDSSNSYERENADLMDDNVAFLEAYVKPDGGRFTVHRLPMPGHRSSTGFGSVPFTYINSTLFNGVNLWPATSYSNWTESRDAAQAVWDEVLPDHQNVWIDATELSFYSGAIHCITRTIPDKTEGVWIDDGTCAAAGGNCTAPSGGYDDACRPAGVDEDICWGPAWLCACNDCESGCDGSSTPDDCQGIPYEGCCDSGDVVYCDGGQLYRVGCQGSGCGWNQWGGYYDCSQSGSDPTGDFPLVCGECTPQCDGKTCGDDGCGGVCGTCSSDAACIDGECRDDCSTCTPGEIDCDGNVAWLCENGVGGCRVKQTVDCGAQGKVCQAGDCVGGAVEPQPEESPEVGPEPQPEASAETSEPREDATGGDDSSVSGDATGTNDTGLGSDTGKPVAHGARDSGCNAAAGGGADIALALAGIGAIAGLARRRKNAPRA